MRRRQKGRANDKTNNTRTPILAQKKGATQQTARNHGGRHSPSPDEKSSVQACAAQWSSKDGGNAAPHALLFSPDLLTSLGCQLAPPDGLGTFERSNPVCGVLEPNHPSVRSPAMSGERNGRKGVRTSDRTIERICHERGVSLEWVSLIRDSTAQPHTLREGAIALGGLPTRTWTDLDTWRGVRDYRLPHKEAIEHPPSTSAVNLWNGEVGSQDGSYEGKGRAMIRSQTQQKINERLVGSHYSPLLERTSNSGCDIEIQRATRSGKKNSLGVTNSTVSSTCHPLISSPPLARPSGYVP